MKLKKGVTDYTDIGNTAKLLVNGGRGNENTGGNELVTGGESGDENPNIIFPYGYIHGYVFLDENDNSLRDTGDTPIANAKVILYKKSGDNWVYVTDTNTNSNGRYEFDQVEYGEYRIVVEHNFQEGNVEYVEQNVSGNRLNGKGSDADKNGVIEFKVDKDNKHPIPTAGLKSAKDNNGDDDGNSSDSNGSGDGNSNSSDNNSSGDDDGDGNGDSDNEKDRIFTKTPSLEEVKAGDTVEYVISGFGNGIGKDMKKYSITDILPKGLHFISVWLPAFSKGEDITYEVVYKTNLSGDRAKMLQGGLDASKEYVITAPDLISGEWIEFISILIDKVPPGFGVSNEIVITCEVDENPETETLINNAAFGYNDTEIMAKTKMLEIGGAPQTGDASGFGAYTVIPVLCLLVIIVMYRRKKGGNKY